MTAERYSTEEMRRLFSDEHTLRLWHHVEVKVLEAQAEHGLIPRAWAEKANAAKPPTPQRWRAREQELGHEMVAFLDLWPAERAHIGLTSSDVIDTANAIRYRQAADEIIAAAYRLREAFIQTAERYWDTPRLGRTHGQAAVVDTFGHRLADLAFATDRAARRISHATRDLCVAKLSGPVGTYEAISPEVEQTAAKLLGLRPAEVATQIVMRDSLAHWAAALVGLVGVCEAFALELRLSSHEGVGELHEPRRPDQRGSSAMPHKRNPIKSEQICGLARVARSALTPIYEGTAQWHQRDLAHSSVERITVQQLCGITHYVARQTHTLVLGMHVDRYRMLLNLQRHPEVLTHSAQTQLQVAGWSHTDAQAKVRDLTGRQPELVLRRAIAAAHPEQPVTAIEPKPNLDRVREQLRLLGARPR